MRPALTCKMIGGFAENVDASFAFLRGQAGEQDVNRGLSQAVGKLANDVKDVS